VSGVLEGEDRRVRIVLRTGVRSPDVWADAAFGPVRRAPLAVPEEDARMERPPATAPLHRYVSLFSRAGGATVYSDGLAEYEVTDEGDVAITLVRAVGELSRNELPERPGHAGWPARTPEAQSQGRFEAELALLLHDGRRSPDTIDLIERTADDVLLPLGGRTLRSALAEYAPAGGLELEGRGLAFSSAKESEDGAWLVLRCVNLLEQPVDGSWRLSVPPREARRARLDETPAGDARVDGDRVRFSAGPREVVTLLVR
jgi:alpha-mannosidase